VSRTSPCLLFAPNTPKDLSRPLADFSRGFQHLVEKLFGQNQTVFLFRQVNQFCRHVAFRETKPELRIESDCLNLPPIPKELKNQKLNFILQPICDLPGGFGEDQLGGLRDIVSKKK